ncbi:MAG: NADP-dependent oxidoreductase [Betaproteobacteria bacterium]|nr:NADP-dependent oxidoreductase [Betaproteobacteria bacterium]
MTLNRRILLARVPRGLPVPADFAHDEIEVVKPSAGQFLSRTIFLSLDPYYRNVMKNSPVYSDRLAPGDVMIGETVAQVIESRHDGYQAGDFVSVRNGWQTFALSDGTGVRRLDTAVAPLSTALGVLGMPGLTGYAGTVFLAEPKSGETFVVSAATGPVGSTAGQVAHMAGARVIGIAGSDEKCEFAVRQLDFAACINYKNGDLSGELNRVCPDGVNAYFDNVGGDTLAAVLGNLARHAVIVLCGMIEAYSLDKPPAGPFLGPVVGARATMKGLVVYDYLDHMTEMQQRVGRLIREGKFHYREDVTEGLRSAPEAFCRLMRGQNFGKALIRVSDT